MSFRIRCNSSTMLCVCSYASPHVQPIGEWCGYLCVFSLRLAETSNTYTLVYLILAYDIVRIAELDDGHLAIGLWRSNKRIYRKFANGFDAVRVLSIVADWLTYKSYTIRTRFWGIRRASSSD